MLLRNFCVFCQVTTVFAADAVARLSGTVGVAAVTAGPGLTNTVTAVKNAQMAESPLLLIGGAAASLLKVRHTCTCIAYTLGMATNTKIST